MALLATVFAAPLAYANTLIFPNPGTSSSCHSSLQGCIDAAASGDTVQIVAQLVPIYSTQIFINESLTITKSLTLTAEHDGAVVDAVLTPGNTITVTSPVTGAMNVTLDHLTVQRGYIRVNHRSDTASTYVVTHSRVIESTGNGGGCGGMIAFGNYAANAGAVAAPTFIATDNVAKITSAPIGTSLPDGICAYGPVTGSPWTVTFQRNHIWAANQSLRAAVSEGGTSSGTVSIVQNQIFGSDLFGIAVSQNSGSASNTLYVDNNSVSGIQSPTSSTAAALELGLTNTQVYVRNNTVAWNSHGLFVSGSGISGRVANNIVAFSQQSGLYVDPSISNDYNLVYANGSNSGGLGVHTITSDPMLIGTHNLRLRSGSPAIDNGNNADAPGLAPFGTDADDEARFVGTVDIGAYEYSGDAIGTANFDQPGRHVSGTGNTVSDYTVLDDYVFPAGDNNAIVLATPQHSSAAPADQADNLGVFELVGTPLHYAVFNENLDLMSLGRGFSVLVPGLARPQFQQLTSASNTSGDTTRMNNPQLGVGSMPFVLHNWNPGGSGGTYHDHSVGVDYSGGTWAIRNQDAATMPAGVSFNVVLATPGSNNAFVAYTADTSGFPSQPSLVLTHPLLDNNPCAAPLVTKNNNNGSVGHDLDNIPLSVAYAPGYNGASGHWSILSESTASGTGAYFPSHAAFNVMVVGSQANACRDDVIFADGYDGVTQ
ncbi:hypothetical protein GCM10009105_36960 [Dokdonella soli]|uniref:DUF7452 domain-containing protein n=2 Tax=Dokdonella soli TaxID=529810 RepID=A0ABN1IZ16_9GAMM